MKGTPQYSGSVRKLTSNSKINGVPSANANRQPGAFAQMGQRMIHIIIILVIILPRPIVTILTLTLIIPTRTLATILTQRAAENEMCPKRHRHEQSHKNLY